MTKPTAFITHPAFLDHDAGAGHPERRQRLETLLRHLEASPLHSKLQHLSPPAAANSLLSLNHAPDHIQKIADLSAANRFLQLTPDTAISPGTEGAARLAVGAAITAVDQVMSGQATNAFCAVRPPGHHAEWDRAMGFCYFNNIALAARHLRQHHKLDKVAIIDWDVHHGNGTQHSFERDPAVFFFSIHQFGPYFFPGTGAQNERGLDQGTGATLNVPLAPGHTDGDYRRIFDQVLRPAIDAFAPDFILLSAGFDAHRNDPLGEMELSEKGFEDLSAALVKMANDHCQGRLVSVLEGGYDLEATARSALAHLAVLSG